MAASMSPEWYSALQKALNQNRSARHSKHVQLATVRPDGSPACRTIVFRGFGENQSLLFCTDSRSKKASDEIPKDPRGELCWYLTVTREQFRIRGNLRLGGPNDTSEDLHSNRLKIWKGMTDQGREQFGWPFPGILRESNREPLYSGEALGADSEPLETFSLLVLEPVFVDHLQLRGNKRFTHELVSKESGTWKSQEVNP